MKAGDFVTLGVLAAIVFAVWRGRKKGLANRAAAIAAAFAAGGAAAAESAATAAASATGGSAVFNVGLGSVVRPGRSAADYDYDHDDNYVSPADYDASIAAIDSGPGLPDLRSVRELRPRADRYGVGELPSGVERRPDSAGVYRRLVPVADVALCASCGAVFQVADGHRCLGVAVDS